MRTLRIDMQSGVAGDMLLAALLDAGGDLEAMKRAIAPLGIGSTDISVESCTPGGIAALRAVVHADQEALWQQNSASIHHHHTTPGHVHRPYAVIRALLEASSLPTRSRDRALRVFATLAQAEATVHGVDPEQVIFHEVGGVDAIVDIVGCCLLLDQLGIDRIESTPLVLGRGSVLCAHGRMPVPVPAVAEMLSQTAAPARQLDDETGELTTPTGAALVCGLTDSFRAETSSRRCHAVGYGAGSKTIHGLVNVLRVHILESDEVFEGDEVDDIQCQIDDMDGEAIAATIDALLTQGALDAYLTPIQMKKGRPGQLLTVLARPEDRRQLADYVLQHTTSIGLRWHRRSRCVLPRSQCILDVDGHAIRFKTVTRPDGSETSKPESDDIKALAVALDLSWTQARDRCMQVWRRSHGQD